MACTSLHIQRCLGGNLNTQRLFVYLTKLLIFLYLFKYHYQLLSFDHLGGNTSIERAYIWLKETILKSFYTRP